VRKKAQKNRRQLEATSRKQTESRFGRGFTWSVNKVQRSLNAKRDGERPDPQALKTMGIHKRGEKQRGRGHCIPLVKLGNGRQGVGGLLRKRSGQGVGHKNAKNPGGKGIGGRVLILKKKTETYHGFTSVCRELVRKHSSGR